jgi:hypothetical protein
MQDSLFVCTIQLLIKFPSKELSMKEAHTDTKKVVSLKPRESGKNVLISLIKVFGDF